MIARWTKPAADDLTHICDYTGERFGPAQARRAALAIHDAADSLKDMPQRGRVGRKRGTRELIIAEFPLWSSTAWVKKRSRSSASSTARSSGRK